MQFPFFPFGQQPRPPFGPPSGRPPFGPGGPGGPGGPEGPPTAPPPSFTPTMSPYRVDPGTIVGCRRRYTYIWLSNGDNFWFYPTRIGRNSIAGYRWFGFFWAFYGIDLDRVNSFVCF